MRSDVASPVMRGSIHTPGRRQLAPGGENRVLPRFGPGPAGGMPCSRAILRMYALVNGESRSTSDGPILARSAAITAPMTACRASS
jgi:hypothetical protein